MNILLTSAGRRGYLVQYFKDALAGGGKVHAGNSSPLAAAFGAADQTVVTPLIYDPSYIPFLLEYCKKEQISLVVPLFDVDLAVLAEHKKQFADEGILVVVSDRKVIEICNDKWNTCCFLNNHQFPVPATYLTTESAIADLSAGKLQYPVVIKPRWGMGSLSVFTAENQMELEVLFEKCKKEITGSYLKYESRRDQAHSVLIQQMIRGEEFGLDVINDLAGVYQTTIVKRKLAMRSGETDAAMVVENEVLEKLGEQLAKAMRHIGNLDTDVLVEGGECYIIDLNARFGGGYPYSHMAGADLPRAITEWARGRTVSAKLLETVKGLCYCKDIVIEKLDIK